MPLILNQPCPSPTAGKDGPDKIFPRVLISESAYYWAAIIRVVLKLDRIRLTAVRIYATEIKAIISNSS